jgi:hypothetical protein
MPSAGVRARIFFVNRLAHVSTPLRPGRCTFAGSARDGAAARSRRPVAAPARLRADPLGLGTFFGDTMVYGGVNAADVWDLLPDDIRRRFDRVAARMTRVMTQLGNAADSVGLIHADLHLDNALVWHDDVRVNDFDDCGSGYWLYDIAVALWELRHRDDYGQFRDALIEGYTQHRPPPGDLALLDDFIATRDVAFGLWFTGTAQANPAFRADLDESRRYRWSTTRRSLIRSWRTADATPAGPADRAPGRAGRSGGREVRGRSASTRASITPC